MNKDAVDMYEFSEKIEDFNDFLLFLKLFRADYELNAVEWKNKDLYSYINALEDFSNDIKFDSAVPSWAFFARILLASIVYE